MELGKLTVNYKYGTVLKNEGLGIELYPVKTGDTYRRIVGKVVYYGLLGSLITLDNDAQLDAENA